MTVTPKMADDWMKKTNKANRTLSPSTVSQYAYDMENGKWVLGYDPIVFNKLGFLENGQHRLAAVQKSGVPTKFFVVTDAEPAIEAYDRGRPRTISDNIRIRSIKNQDEVKNVKAKVSTSRFILGNGYGIQKPSDSLLYDFISDNNSDLDRAIETLGSGSIQKRSPFIVASFVSLKCGVDDKTLKEFFRIVSTGFQNEPWQTSPIIVRNLLYEIGSSRKDRFILEGMTEYAINDFVNKKPRRIRYKPVKEKLPYFNTFIEENDFRS